MAKKSPKADKDAGKPAGDGTDDVVLDYRHPHERRLNNPTGGNATEGKVAPSERPTYAYDPHRSPGLRFDGTGRADALTEKLDRLLAKAQMAPTGEGPGSLSAAEVTELADALRQRQPWLEWAGKQERPEFVVDAPAIHLHERVSTRALLRVASRRDVQRSLFGETELPYSQSVQFYHHAVNWSNRLILGDNRAVMASLAQREGLAGKVQMIFLDPPYGIKFGSNFQPEIGKRTVGDIEADLTREMETVKAYRDTWKLGVHSYLRYIEDCLVVSKGLLADSGSIFLQIGEENLHLVRSLMDEVFGSENFCSCITFVKTAGQPSTLLSSVADYLLWYSKDIKKVKTRRIFRDKLELQTLRESYSWLLVLLR